MPFLTSKYAKLPLQVMLTDIMTDSSNTVLSSSSTRLDYGQRSGDATFTQFKGFDMDGTTQAGFVNGISITAPANGNTGFDVNGLPGVALADLFDAAAESDPLDALNRVLSGADWNGNGSALSETFVGFYSQENINAQGGYDTYHATMAPDQERDIIDSFNGGAAIDTVTFKATTGVTVQRGGSSAVFNETVNGVEYSRTVEMINVEKIEGSGNADLIRGSSDDDLLFGAGGDDVIRGAEGADILRGAGGADEIHGGRGADKVFGGKGADLLRGGAGADLLEGRDGADRMHGGADNDHQIGGRGKDAMNGGAGSDILRGKKGADTIQGGGGDDRIIGGVGDDRLTGGGGNDRFIFRTDGHFGEDVITDFDVVRDRLALTGEDTAFSLSHEGADTLADYAGGTIRLLNVHLTEDDFGIFA